MKTDTTQIITHSHIGKQTKVWHFVNIYGAIIGNNCMIGSFVEIQEGVRIGNNVRIQSHAFLCAGVIVENDVFIGHHVVFTNDKYPRSGQAFDCLTTRVKEGASIGSNATILPGVTIGKYAMIGAGAVVCCDVPHHTVVAGNPARSTHLSV